MIHIFIFAVKSAIIVKIKERLYLYEGDSMFFN